MARRLDNAVGKQIRSDNSSHSIVFQKGKKLGKVLNLAQFIRLLASYAAKFFRFLPWEVLQFVNSKIDSGCLSSRLYNSDCLREHCVGNKEALAFMIVSRKGHAHSFSNRGCFVKEWSVSNVHGSQLCDHCLKVQQHLEAPLWDLTLIRCIRRVPFGVLKHITLNDSW